MHKNQGIDNFLYFKRNAPNGIFTNRATTEIININSNLLIPY